MRIFLILFCCMHFSDKPSGQPAVITNGISPEIISVVSLSCDTKDVDGIISWYVWQFSNGTQIQNTTSRTMMYRTGTIGKINFTCIAGNSTGATIQSEPVEIALQNICK